MGIVEGGARFLVLAVIEAVVAYFAIQTITNEALPDEVRAIAAFLIWPFVIVCGTIVWVAWLWRDRAKSPASSELLLDKYRRALRTLVTWLYRRDNWPGLSRDRGQISEAAPWAEYAKERYQHLGLGDEPYERTNDAGAEPGFEPTPWHPALLRLYIEGADLLDTLRSMRSSSVSSVTRSTMRQQFESWDKRVGREVVSRYGQDRWGRFGGDNGSMPLVGDDDFPQWVKDMARDIDRRMQRIRWQVRGGQGLMP